MTVKYILPFVLAAMAAPLRADDAFSWSWNCEDQEYVRLGNIPNKIHDDTVYNSTHKNSTQDFTIESGADGSTKSGCKYLKLTPDASTNGGHYSFINMPTDGVTGDFSFSFDYAPERNSANDQPTTSYGLAVHDSAGKALVTLNCAEQNDPLNIYKGADSEAQIGSIAATDITARGQSNGDSTKAKWFRITLTGSKTTGLSLTVTKLSDNTQILADSVLCEDFSVPKYVLVKTAVYSKRPQWALLDEFSFSGSVADRRTLDCSFTADAEKDYLLSEKISTTLLGTSGASGTWAYGTCTAGIKNGENIAYMSSSGTSITGGKVAIPETVRKSAPYAYSVDVAINRDGQTSSYVNGLAFRDAEGKVLTTFVSQDATGTDTRICEGDSTDEIWADKLSVPTRTNPLEAEGYWYRFIVSCDSSGNHTLKVVSLHDGSVVVDEKSLDGAIADIAVAVRTKNSGRPCYAAIGNIRGYVPANDMDITLPDESESKTVQSPSLDAWLAAQGYDLSNATSKNEAQTMLNTKQTNGLTGFEAYAIGLEVPGSMVCVDAASVIGTMMTLGIGGTLPTIEGISREFTLKVTDKDGNETARTSSDGRFSIDLSAIDGVNYYTISDVTIGWVVE